uniref:Uncharacterized protein n=1 Tax=Rhizophora mucronata TaxID=61149 RepID=A0A2P2R1L2_RHIMU
MSLNTTTNNNNIQSLMLPNLLLSKTM